jgi:hypothetical protein
MKEPSSGHNKNCKLETPYVAVGDLPLYTNEYTANVYNNLKNIVYIYRLSTMLKLK